MKIPLLSGAYEARSLIANCQRCVNLYPEQNPSDSPFPTTHYPTPGLARLGASTDKAFRGLYPSTNGRLYAVVGQGVYRISATWTFTKLGTIASFSGPVVMNDNSLSVMLVDGSPAGYKIDLVTDAFSVITDPAFYGSTRVDVVDGYFILNRPGTNQWYISKFLSNDFDALDFAGKTGYSDNLVCAVAARRYVYLLGQQTCEVWYNDGSTDFTFARMPGAFIQHGCAAPYSVATMDGAAYWVSKDPQGHAVVLRTANFDAERISTHAIENEFQGYARLDDAIAFTYQQGGHYFYFLSFPTADKTWCYDISTKQWHEREWRDALGQFHRHRASCIAYFNGKHVVGDWENGNLYSLDQDVFDDDGVDQVHIRTFPHMIEDGNRVTYQKFIADMEVGNGLPGETDPLLMLRWSDSKGKSWGNHITSSIGKTGDYLNSIQFQRLGLARDRVFELSWSAHVKTALNGAFVDAVGVQS